MSKDIVSIMTEIVGQADVLTGSAARERVSAWETHQPCHAKAIVRPSTTAEVAAIMKACHENDQSVVPYGGLTNLVQGCKTTPDDIALSFEKMNTIEEIDTIAHTMTVQAGVTMQAAQEKAEGVNLRSWDLVERHALPILWPRDVKRVRQDKWRRVALRVA